MEVSLFSNHYWKRAAANFTSNKMLCFAALIAALRVAVKFFEIQLGGGLYLTFDCYINALGSFVYGPLMGLAVGAVSDSLGCLLAPKGAYFLPYILVEMSSSFLFGLFLWQQKISVNRILLAKFTVNFTCNIVLNSLFYKWQLYLFYGVEKAQAYALINTVRIFKNLITFPLESVLIALVISAFIPALISLRLTPPNTPRFPFTRKNILTVIVLFLLSVALLLLYVFVLKDYISAHPIKIW